VSGTPRFDASSFSSQRVSSLRLKAVRLKRDHCPFYDVTSNRSFENGWKADFAFCFAF
jgi:hypothetical protein